jgi:glycosyltransferase involved in cell wall biosynthesis
LRIAFDATVVRPPYSGVHYAVRNQLTALLEQFAKKEPVCFASDCEVAVGLARYPEISTHVQHNLTKVWRRVLWQQLRLPKLLKQYDCDRLLALAYTAPRKCSVPYTVQVHDTIALRCPKLCTWLNARHMRTLMPQSIRGAEHVITSADTVADEIVALTGVDRQRVHVIPLGVDDLFLQPSLPVALPEAFQADQPYILFVGNIEPKKGLETLLDAFERVAKKSPVTLLLAGQPGWKCGALLKRIDQYRGPGTIRRLGYVDRELLPALYEGAKLFVFPSVEEGFGLPVLEAMARGTITIHSDHPVLCGTSGGIAATFPTGDAAALAAVIERHFSETGNSAEFATRGREWAQAHTWQRWADAVADATGYFS